MYYMKSMNIERYQITKINGMKMLANCIKLITLL